MAFEKVENVEGVDDVYEVGAIVPLWDSKYPENLENLENPDIQRFQITTESRCSENPKSREQQKKLNLFLLMFLSLGDLPA